ncbi:hypothetical protein X777_11078 [Ooceraea biroi]|nr:hypothetical protein X777_11078 [Ooceraea biroi]
MGERATADPIREQLVPAEPPRNPTASSGCWNCTGDHRYVNCPLPRMHSFCYGCGERQVTLRNCPRCGPFYQRTSPYRAPRGPRDGRRGPPSPDRTEDLFNRSRSETRRD